MSVDLTLGPRPDEPGPPIGGRAAYPSEVTERLAADETLSAKDVTGATAALGKTVSVVDKMATKGIIHTNTASRYKSRLGASIVRAAAASA